MFESRQPDCVLTDLIMPNMDGYELIRQIRTKNPEAPIIVLTSDTQKLSKKMCEELGAGFFLNKPLDKEELEQTLSLILDA